MQKTYRNGIVGLLRLKQSMRIRVLEIVRIFENLARTSTNELRRRQKIVQRSKSRHYPKHPKLQTIQLKSPRLQALSWIGFVVLETGLELVVLSRNPQKKPLIIRSNVGSFVVGNSRMLHLFVARRERTPIPKRPPRKAQNLAVQIFIECLQLTIPNHQRVAIWVEDPFWTMFD